MNQPVYREPLLEFFATFDFDRESLGIDDPDAIMFRLGNVIRTCSITEFGVRLGIYTQAELDGEGFAPFLRSVAKASSYSLSYADFWGTISCTRYHANTVLEGHMHLPSHRMLHRLISTMFWPRADMDLVTYHDLYFM